jgi:hypothetical protein
MPIIPAFRRLKQEDHKLKVSLGYAGNSTPLQKKNPKNKKQKPKSKTKHQKAWKPVLLSLLKDEFIAH